MSAPVERAFAYVGLCATVICVAAALVLMWEKARAWLAFHPPRLPRLRRPTTRPGCTPGWHSDAAKYDRHLPCPLDDDPQPYDQHLDDNDWREWESEVAS